jgi:hypothetical protein
MIEGTIDLKQKNLSEKTVYKDGNEIKQEIATLNFNTNFEDMSVNITLKLPNDQLDDLLKDLKIGGSRLTVKLIIKPDIQKVIEDFTPKKPEEDE